MHKIFIDGSVGTTGLKIVERLKERKDLSLITLPEEIRKDIDELNIDNYLKKGIILLSTNGF